MPRVIFHDVCGANLRRQPGRTCHKSPVAGKRRCRLHGGAVGSGRPAGSRSAPGTRRPGPKPVAKRRQLHAELLRTDPEAAALLAPLVTGGPGHRPKDAPRTAQADHPPGSPPEHWSKDAPPWPRDGYYGSQDVQALEKHEREFITQLNETIDLDALLAQATGWQPQQLPAVQLGAVLVNFVASMRASIEERLATFMEAEHVFRRDGASFDKRSGAIAQRLARLEYEAADYLTRLDAAKTVIVLRAESRERQAQERAMAATEAMVGHHVRMAEARAGAPAPVEPQYHSIAPWLNRRP